MSFIDDITNFITPGLGSVISGGLGFLGQMDTNAISASNAQAANAFNAQQAQISRDYQTEMSNTAYQRQVADLSAAGLNPMLAYIKGGGASTPSSPTATAIVPQYQSPIQGMAQYKLTSAQASKTEAEKPKVEAETALTNSQINQVNSTVDKIKQELENMPKGLTMGRSVSEWNTEAIRFAVEKVKDESALLRNRATSEDVYQNQMRALIDKLKNETELGKLDLKAAQQMLNAGRLGKELQPFASMLFSLMRAAR